MSLCKRPRLYGLAVIEFEIGCVEEIGLDQKQLNVVFGLSATLAWVNVKKIDKKKNQSGRIHLGRTETVEQF